MNRNRAYIRYTQAVIISVFLVILAGGIVRTTQSGMGCPDWPRCFGRWIPPVNAGQLPPDYEKYLNAQDIDHTFNAWHTWIEWINRLCTGLLGLLIIGYVVWSYKKFYRLRPLIFWLAFSMIAITGIEAWLGKLVVNSNLGIFKITGHMLLALGLASIPVKILALLDKRQKIRKRSLKWISGTALMLLLIQVILGTDVRQQIDQVSKSLDYTHRELWIGRLNVVFGIHRSFSWVVAFACGFLYWKVSRLKGSGILKRPATAGLALVVLLMALGIVMAFCNIPAWIQPLHLLCSSMLVMVLFSFRLRLS